MAANLVPSDPQSGALAQYPAAGGAQMWSEPSAPPRGVGLGDQVARALGAILRYKWLILAILATGSAAGAFLARWVPPKYEVYGTIWIARSSANSGGPVGAPGLISDALAWPDVAKSFVVLDKVVSNLALYVEPTKMEDAEMLRELRPSRDLQTGSYTLNVDASGSRYTLTRRSETGEQLETPVDDGAVGDSIGRRVGFLWSPKVKELRGGRTVSFRVVTPREAAQRLSKALVVYLFPNSNLMRLSLQGENPVQIAATLNEVQQVFVLEAARLKKENLTAVYTTVEEQLDSARHQLDRTSAAYESFRVASITQPSENTQMVIGSNIASSPVVTQYFLDKAALDNTSNDRKLLESVLAEATGPNGKLSIEALKAITPVIQANKPLNDEIMKLDAAKTDLSHKLQRYTDEHLLVRNLRDSISFLENQSIPALARQSLEQLRREESDRNQRITGQASALQKIPQRTIEEAKRKREMDVAAQIYTGLRTQAENAKLAELTAMPDVSVLDPVIAPVRPTTDTKLGILLVAIAGSLGLGIVLALLLDRTDKRFRYPEQATKDLGLDIMGAIPTVTNPRNSSARLQESSQLVEAFRSLSLSVRSAFEGVGPVLLTVSSPGPGDGKSFISANLAMALADGGYRTVLVDGDIRRGALHSVFAPMPQTPGLLEYLSGDSILGDVIRSTSHENLFVIPGGKRRRHGPELLAGEGMNGLVRELRGQFDAVIFDSAPLGAGIDPYALGVATGAMLIVLRTGETDRKFASAKLEVLDRMPVRVLGTVLNDIGESPQFKYYYYLEGYGALETAEEEQGLIGAGAKSNGNGASGDH